MKNPINIEKAICWDKKHLARTNKLYRYSVKEKAYINSAGPESKEIDDYINRFTSEAVGLKTRLTNESSKYLEFEKPNYPKKYLEAEERYLKNTYEGSLLLGYKPWSTNGHTPKDGILAYDYREIVLDNKMLVIPITVWEDFHPDHLKNPSIIDR